MERGIRPVRRVIDRTVPDQRAGFGWRQRPNAWHGIGQHHPGIAMAWRARRTIAHRVMQRSAVYVPRAPPEAVVVAGSGAWRFAYAPYAL